MITITFPDKTQQQFQQGITPLEIAKNISPKLSKEVVVASVNGVLWDLTLPIEEDVELKLHKFEEAEGKHAFWHSSAHLLAEALQALYPGIKFGIGPAIDQGFYYDVDLEDGQQITEKDFPRIEQKMLELAKQKSPFIRELSTKEEAIQYYQQKDNKYKVELINELEDQEVTFYTHGQFTDLCKGPHLPDTSRIKAVKILSAAGAYWRGNIHNKQLTRIYGITFPQQKMLDEYLEQLEKAKENDHRKLGKELGLFTFSSKVGQGLPLWLPKGAALRERLEQFLKNLQLQYGYEAVLTPHIGQKELYVTSGHYTKFGANSFQPIHTPDETEEFLLKPMNCPHHCEIYKNERHTYRDLPIRYAEFGTVYRYEQSGELHGLTRVRGFTQDDAHIFCRPDQLGDEFMKVIDIILHIFKVLDFHDFETQVSLRDPLHTEEYIGSDENWEKAEQAILEATESKGLTAKVEYGEAAFYGPKLDFMVKDALGRSWQLGTIQVDYNLPDRFEMEYIGSDDQKHRPVMIHRAPFGSMERFIAVLLEHTGGKFPLWLTPDQIMILPISEKYHNYARTVKNTLNQNNIRANIDERNEKIGKKIRESELKKIPYALIVGEQEANDNTVSVRKQGDGDKGSMNLENFIKFVHQEIQQSLTI